MAIINQDLLKKRAEELKNLGYNREKINSTLMIEKQMGNFSGNTTPKQPTQPVPEKPAQTNTTPKQLTINTQGDQTGLSFIQKLALRNAEDQKKYAEINKQRELDAQAKKDAQPPALKNTATYGGQKPSQAGSQAGLTGMEMINQQGQKQQDDIMKQYQDDIATIKLEEDQAKAKYKNADQVLAGIRAVEDSYKRGVMDPQQISSQTGIPMDQVNQILRGEGFKALELQDWATENDRKDFQYQMSELQTTKSRSVDDLADQAERSKYNYDQQVDDMLNQANLTEANMMKTGALTGAIQSSGYRMAIDMVRTDTKKQLDRIKTIQGRDQEDVSKARTRLLEDFETNQFKIKDYFDRGMNTLRMGGLAQIQQINQKYGVASQNTVNALKQLYNDMEQQKISLLNETMQLQQSFNSMRTQEIDLLENRRTDSTKSSNQDLQTYLEIYKVDPQMANSMFPQFANKINRESAKSKYGSTPAVRNFNPGNITDTAFGGQKVEGERFTVFDTPLEGFNALIQKVKYNQTNPQSAYYGKTIAQYFQKYAPSSDNNDPQAYAQDVANRLGVNVNTKISELDPVKFASQIARHEDKNSYQMLLDLGIITADGSLGQNPQSPGLQTSTGSLSPEAQSVIDGMITIDKIPSADRIRILNEIQTSGKQILSTKVITNSKKTIDLIDEILASTGFGGAVGRSREKFGGIRDKPFDGTPAFDVWKKIESLKSLVAIPYLENMKGLGAMSEKEFTAMKDASSALDQAMTEKGFKAEVEKVKVAMNDVITRNGGEPYVPTQQQARSPKSSGFVIDPNK